MRLRKHINPFLMTDFYKIGHPFQYHPGTNAVYANFTPRVSRMAGVTHMVWYGMQYLSMRYLIDYFNDSFFHRPRGEVMDEYRRRIRNSIGDLPSYDHIEEIHVLGYLPIHIKALQEGTVVPMRVPAFTIRGTGPKYYWITNFFETLASCVLWPMCTSATIAHEFRKMLDGYARATGMPEDFVQFQGHDFSFRGLFMPEAAMASGSGHLLSFVGTDTIPAIDFLEQYYGADCEKELIGCSVPATEHSVMCAGGEDDEIGTIRRLITEVYPKGIVSIVSDTWDLWRVLIDYLPRLKPEIMARDGKVVIRPDSGDPVKVLCGDLKSTVVAERAGVIELLWHKFGGTMTVTKHRLLDSHVGSIYGDGISRDRGRAICEGLMAKGFASQEVFGLGSFTYQYNTRDTFGTAIKATWVDRNGVPMPIFKKPVTDDGTKHSATGLLRVDRVDGELVLRENVSPEEEMGGELGTVFYNGQIMRTETLSGIRTRLAAQRAEHCGGR